MDLHIASMDALLYNMDTLLYNMDALLSFIDLQRATPINLHKGGSTEIFPINFKINLFIIKLNNCIN